VAAGVFDRLGNTLRGGSLCCPSSVVGDREPTHCQPFNILDHFSQLGFGKRISKESFMDLRTFANLYAKAWCSQKPETVAVFYAERGSLSVNGGPPAIGRPAIAEVARGFMTAFPDMEVTMDDLVHNSHEPYGTAFHWTLTGTNTGPGGTGNRVRISGYELWRLDENGQIVNSQGHFDVAQYERQVIHGVDD
jgi:predicted ester cyclase